ncbi:hypothetical protein M408DRAFT_24133 [Serendipita vermifera MAFF 305830]|uniref:Uncharacterized protein n=1 Tax=Serendipita vermifera MAFF 305830 TaxID=933852 RepID=A0A0C3AUA2_SERVB|nr:hypothetical protein M408DRAFT_24133 [Serendipita vermifera MAFF 305830]
MTTTSEHTGTVRYLSPELVSSGTSVPPTLASDVYALGSLGLEPFFSSNGTCHRPHAARHDNVTTGTSFVLVYVGEDGKLISTGLLQSQDNAGSGNACLTNISPHSTAHPTGTEPTGVPDPTNTPRVSAVGGNSPTLNTAAIIGGIVGGVAFIAIISFLTFFCIIRRTAAMGRPKSRSMNSAQGHSPISPYKEFEWSVNRVIPRPQFGTD